MLAMRDICGLLNSGAFLLFGMQHADAFRATTSSSTPIITTVCRRHRTGSPRSRVLLLHAEKSYGKTAQAPIQDVIDQEGAMEAFFGSRQEWFPLFRKIAGDALPADTASLLQSIEEDRSEDDSSDVFDFSEKSSPWRKFEAIPRVDEDRDVVASFLDSMHATLLEIPVTEVINPEEADDDEDDVQFLEEGRRMLAINRFHVLQRNAGGSIESVDALFAHCWSEVYELTDCDESSGSIIMLPEYELSDLRRFSDMNVVRPLQWLGVDADFEVVSLHRGSPALRLLYKLSDMPSGAYTEEDGFAADVE